MDIPGSEAGRAARDQEPSDAVLGPGPDHGDVGDAAVGDPHLGAGKNPVGAVLPGEGPHAARVGTVIGLGQAEASDRFPGRHPGQPLVFLFLRPEAPDRVHGQRALDRRGAAKAGVAGLEFPARDAVGDSPGTGAAVAGQVHAEHPQLAELRHDVPGQRALLEPVLDVRQHPVAGEGAYGVTDEPLFVGQLFVDLQQVRVRRACGHGRSSRLAQVQGINRDLPDVSPPPQWA